MIYVGTWNKIEGRNGSMMWISGSEHTMCSLCTSYMPAFLCILGNK